MWGGLEERRGGVLALASYRQRDMALFDFRSSVTFLEDSRRNVLGQNLFKICNTWRIFPHVKFKDWR